MSLITFSLHDLCRLTQHGRNLIGVQLHSELFLRLMIHTKGSYSVLPCRLHWQEVARFESPHLVPLNYAEFFLR